MNENKEDNALIRERNQPQWKLHQQIAQFAKELDRLPEAREAILNKPRSSPQSLLPMVF